MSDKYERSNRKEALLLISAGPTIWLEADMASGIDLVLYLRIDTCLRSFIQ